MKNTLATTFLACLVYLIFSNSIIAQHLRDSASTKWSVKVSPFAMFSGTIDVALAYYINQRFSTEIKVGSNFIRSPDFSGSKVFAEFQCQVHPEVVMAMEFGISSLRMNDSFEYYQRDSIHGFEIESSVTDDFSYRLTRFSVTPKVTLIIHKAKHFQLEGFAGIGWKRVQRDVYNLEFDEGLGHVDPVFYEGWFSGKNYLERSWTSARVALGMNFCFLINRRT